MPQKLSGPMLSPLNGEPPHRLLVLLHGYGSDGSDLIALGRQWQPQFPDVAFLAPNAPYPCDNYPVGYQWFPVAFDTELRGLERIRTARPFIEEFLADLWAATGLQAADTILAGFSQGAMVALDSGLHLDEDLAGIIAFSGGIPHDAEPDFKTKKPVPVCLLHGAADEVVKPAMSLHAKELLVGAGIDVRLTISEGEGHTITEEGLAVATDFLRERWPL